MSRTHSKPHEIVERALELSTADGCVVIADEHSTANLRWAGNALTTNGVTRGRTLTVIATVDGKEGTASGVVSRSAVTADELEPLVRAAEARRARARGPPRTRSRWSTGRHRLRGLHRRARRDLLRGLRGLRAGARRGLRPRPRGRPRAVRLRQPRARLQLPGHLDGAAAAARPAQRARWS